MSSLEAPVANPLQVVGREAEPLHPPAHPEGRRGQDARRRAVAGRLPRGRDEGREAPRQRPAHPHPRRQPPRVGPRDRPERAPRHDGEGHRDPEAEQLQPRPHRPLPERARVVRARRRVRALPHRRVQHRVARHGLRPGQDARATSPSGRRRTSTARGGTSRRSRTTPPSIIWSLGNEAGDGVNFVAASKWIHEHDPTRPVHYERAEQKPHVDIVSHMYQPRRGHGPRGGERRPPPAHPVRVLARDGQQQRRLRRVLEALRVGHAAPAAAPSGTGWTRATARRCPPRVVVKDRTKHAPHRPPRGHDASPGRARRAT